MSTSFCDRPSNATIVRNLPRRVSSGNRLILSSVISTGRNGLFNRSKAARQPFCSWSLVAYGAENPWAFGSIQKVTHKNDCHFPKRGMLHPSRPRSTNVPKLKKNAQTYPAKSTKSLGIPVRPTFFMKYSPRTRIFVIYSQFKNQLAASAYISVYANA